MATLPSLPSSTQKRDRTNENFSRATQRLMRRCNQLSDRYNADVYIVVRRNHRHYDYNSTNDPLFPTPLIDIVRKPIPGTYSYPLAIRRTPASFKQSRAITPLSPTSSPMTSQRDSEEDED
ncbi:hypothetical protein EDB81DRAFT_919670, partial [Dactylonectria macrodidyma]